MLGLPKRPSIHRPLLSINQCFYISLDASCTALPDEHVFFFPQLRRADARDCLVYLIEATLGITRELVVCEIMGS